jgi:FAD/FMN-containing dehydrogenase
VQKAGGEVLKACVEVGGTITGEHGVGVEKLEYMRFVFSENDIDTMARIRDVFNPARLCNPDKVVPPAAGLLEQAEGVN